MTHEEYGLLILEEANGVSYIVDMEKYELIYLTRAGMEAYGLEKAEDYVGKNVISFCRGWTNPARSVRIIV